MSDQDEKDAAEAAHASEAPEPTEPIVAGVPEALPPGEITEPMATVPIVPPVPSGPYRLPADAIVLPPLPEAPAKATRPLFGPAVSVFAVLLWAFVVVGQYTTSWTFGVPLGEGVAIGMVLLATFAAWLANVRWSGIVTPPASTGRFVLRALGIGALAVALFGLTILVATILGGVLRRSAELVVPFALVFLATVAAIAGPRLTSPMRPIRTHRGRFLLVTLWLGGTILTLIAGVDLAAYGHG
jgi:hypothetical protein